MSEKLHFHAPIGALDPLKAIDSYIVFSRIRESSLSDNHHWPELLDFQKTPSVMRRGGKMRFPNAMVNINYGLESWSTQYQLLLEGEKWLPTSPFKDFESPNAIAIFWTVSKHNDQSLQGKRFPNTVISNSLENGFQTQFTPLSLSG